MEGQGPPSFDGGVLTVQLPKAEVARVRLSSYLGPQDLNQMGIWRWLLEAGLPDSQVAYLQNQALKGTHWMLTPFRELVLVHAVQQPLPDPPLGFEQLEVLKELGKTFAFLTGRIVLSGKSTGKVDVEAQWTSR